MSARQSADSVRSKVLEITRKTGTWMEVKTLAKMLDRQPASFRGTLNNMTERGELETKLGEECGKLLYRAPCGIRPRDIITMPWRNVG